MKAIKIENESVTKGETRRLLMLGVFFTLLLLVVLFRAFTFQVWKREPWDEMAMSQYQRRVKLIAERGVIYDRNMNILAMDAPIISLAMDPSQAADVKAVSETLATILGGDVNAYRDAMMPKKRSSFVLIKKEISDEQRDRLFESKMPGLIFIKGRKRVHPYEELARQVLGVTNADHCGVGGVEQVMDGILRGGDGWAIFQKDGLNRNFSSLDYPVTPPNNGHHIVLNLDHAYQTIVEEELRKGVERHDAKSGMAVLMDPFTGEVLAMASVLGERFQDGKPSIEELLQNLAVQVDFEPGSVFKIVTAAAALEKKAFEPNSLIHCENGSYRLSNHTIHDHDKAYAWLTLSQVLENSSNIGMAKVGKKLGKEVLYKYVQNFGFGSRTGIAFPNEADGILRPIYRWTEFSTASVSFGQELSVTGLQLACMVSAVANGGELMRPRILRAILDESGAVVESRSRQVIRRVIAEETASTLTHILEGVVRDGGGKEAGVEGVRMAGKTGTGQKSSSNVRGYIPGAYVCSFAGFWPADAPMFAMVVSLNEPKKAHTAAVSAAPVFARIVERIVGIPTEPRPIDRKEDGAKKFLFSSVQEKVADEANENRRRDADGIDSPHHIPSLVGLSMREALHKLAARGVAVRVTGNGVVVAQEPKPGTKVGPEMICQLTCRVANESGSYR